MFRKCTLSGPEQHFLGPLSNKHADTSLFIDESGINQQIDALQHRNVIDFVKLGQLRRGRNLFTFKQLVIDDLVLDLFLDLDEQGPIIWMHGTAQ